MERSADLRPQLLVDARQIKAEDGVRAAGDGVHLRGGGGAVQGSSVHQVVDCLEVGRVDAHLVHVLHERLTFGVQLDGEVVLGAAFLAQKIEDLGKKIFTYRTFLVLFCLRE